MHTASRMSGSVCKCMDCAETRWKRAEQEARECNPDDYFGLLAEEGQALTALIHAKNALKTISSDKHDLIMIYYHKLANEKD